MIVFCCVLPASNKARDDDDDDDDDVFSRWLGRTADPLK